MAQMKKGLVVCEIIIVRDRTDTFVGRCFIRSKSRERLEIK